MKTEEQIEEFKLKLEKIDCEIHDLEIKLKLLREIMENEK